jgi:hypothetical protein
MVRDANPFFPGIFPGSSGKIPGTSWGQKIMPVARKIAEKRSQFFLNFF